MEVEFGRSKKFFAWVKAQECWALPRQAPALLLVWQCSWPGSALSSPFSESHIYFFHFVGFFVHSHHLDLLLQAPPLHGDNGIVSAPGSFFLKCFPRDPVLQACPRIHPSLLFYFPLSFRQQIFPILLHSCDAEPRESLGSGPGPTAFWQAQATP